MASTSNECPAASETAIEHAIFALLAARKQGATVCPSEVARALDGNGHPWRTLMPQVRAVAHVLVQAGRLRVTQRGAEVDAIRCVGPIRLGAVSGQQPRR